MALTDALLLDPQKLDIWIALRADGARGSGTESDPYDGSVRPKTVLSGIAISRVGTEATVAANNHGYANGNVVVIAGAAGADAPLYNGTFPIYGVTPNAFKYRMNGTPGGSASGGPTCTLDPYEFDSVMRGLPANTAVHLGPGTFETKGFSFSATASWQPKSGQNMIGSGIDISVLRLVGASITNEIYTAIGNFWYDPLYRVTNFEVSDLTVDCNQGGQPIPSGKAFAPVACGAVQVGGSHIGIRRIRVINFGTQTLVRECFVLTAGWTVPGLAEVVDCVIEDCVLEKPAENNARETTCIAIGGLLVGAVHAYHRACVIRNCVVKCYYANGVSNQIIAIKTITQVAGLQYEIETYSAHNRTAANNIAVTNVYVTPSPGAKPILSTVLNGSFSIDQIVSATKLRYTLLSAADGSDPGGGFVGVPFHGLGASGGTGAVIEGNRVYGARFGHYGDTGSSKDLMVRNNLFFDVVCGVYHSMGYASAATSASSLSAIGNIATFTATSGHYLLPGSAVQITLAKIDGADPPPNTYNGFYEVMDVPATPTDPNGNPTTFRYQMGGSPGAPADPGTGVYAEYWRVRHLIVENNLTELSPTLPGTSPSYGILLADYPNQTSLNIFLQIVIRGNVIRELNDMADPSSVGIALVKCAEGLIEQNVIDPAVGRAVVQNLSGILEYFDNSTPGGLLLQGYDQQTARKVDELATRVEDSVLASI